MYYQRYPCQDWGYTPMFLPYQWPNWYPPNNGYYGGVYGNSFNQTAGNVPQIMAGQYQAHPPQQMQQGNPNQGNSNLVPYQGPASNYNTAYNGNYGCPYAQTNGYPNNQPPQNSLQMNCGQNQGNPNQGNSNLVPYQGPASNYNTAYNGNYGCPNAQTNGYPNNQPPQNSLQMNCGQNQAHQPQQMQQGNPNQGNSNLVPYQGPASNYNTAYNGNYGCPYAQTNGYPNNQPPQNSLQMNCGQNQVALTSGNQQMQQLSHDNNSISRGGVTENPGMAVESVTKLCEAVTNSINGNGTKDPITLKLNIPKFGLDMSYEKGSNVSSATEKE